MPSINQVHREWGPKGVSVVLVSIREDSKTVGQAVAERGYIAPVVLDLDGAVSDTYGIRATPTTFLVARDGAIAARAIGPRPWTGSDGRALFQALLALPR